MAKHEIEKVRLEPIRRKMQVAAKEFLTPQMLRIDFTSKDLAGFRSPSPDDHIKLFFPTSGQDSPAMRDFTPRAWDSVAGRFTLEFALHADGPAVTWAQAAAVGDLLEIGGPRGSTVVPDDFDWYLLVGDASALPSIARRLESLRPGVSTTAIVEVATAEEAQTFAMATACSARWLVPATVPSRTSRICLRR